MRRQARERVQFSSHSLEPRRLLASIAWDGGGDNFRLEDPRNWAGDVLPGAGDDATIESASPTSLTLSTALTLNSIRISSRALIVNASGSLAVSSTSAADAGITLSGGQLSTAGRFDINGLLSTMGRVVGGGSVFLAGASHIRPQLNATTPVWSVDLINGGALTMSSLISLGSGSDFVNLGTMRFERFGNSPANGALYITPGSSITNTGSLFAVHDAYIGSPFFGSTTLNLGGEVRVGSGAILRVVAEGTMTATTVLEPTSNIEFQRNIEIDASIVGPEGRITFYGGTANVVKSPLNLGALSLVVSTKVRFDSDCIFNDGEFTFGETSGPGKLTFNREFEWGSGIFANPGGVEFGPNSQLHIGTPGNTDAYLKTTLTNYGVMDLQQRIPQGQSFRLGDGARLINRGRFDLTNASAFPLQIVTGPGSGTIENHGLLRFDSPGTSSIYVGMGGTNGRIQLYESGNVEVVSGRVRLSATNTSISGLVNLLSGSTLQVGSGFSVGELPTVVTNATVTGLGTLLANWRVDFNGVSSVSNLTLDRPQGAQAYNIVINGRLLIAQSLQWGNVGIDGTGALTLVDGTTTLFGLTTSRRSSAAIDNFGTLRMGNEPLELANASLRNYGTIELGAASLLTSGSGSVINDGTIRQTSNAQALIQGLTHRAGTLSALNLRLVRDFNAPLVSHGGRFLAESEGAIIRFDGKQRLTDTSALSAELSLHVAGGRLESGIGLTEMAQLRVTDGGRFAFLPGSSKSLKVSSIDLGADALQRGSLEVGLNTVYVDYSGTNPVAAITEWARLGTGGFEGLVPGTAVPALAVSLWASTERFLAFPASIGGNLTIDATTQIVRGTSRGDLTFNNTTDFADLLKIAQYFDQSGRSYAEGNLNYDPDGIVDFSDLLIIAQNFGARTFLRPGPAPKKSLTAKSHSAELLDSV